MQPVQTRTLSAFNREAPLAFGPFQLYAAQKVLLNQGEPVRLGGRAIDLLLALVQQPGQLLSPRDLVAQVWPHRIVEDSSLRAHVAALRRALRDGPEGHCYISNVPGRGYSFLARVERRCQDGPVERLTASPRLRRIDEFVRLSSIVGRARDLERVTERLRLNRLVNLVGPGGVGKSTLATAAACILQQHFADGVFHLDLRTVRNNENLADEIARAVVGEIHNGASDEPGNHKVLLILDNCEHLIEVASTFTERILLSMPNLTILATSREPLLNDGEFIYRVAPLGLPPANYMPLSDPSTYPALQLFLERASCASNAFESDSASLQAAAHICRCLDGLPLALEIAAASIATLGLSGLCKQLGHQQLLFNSARRNGPINQTSLQACYRWSFAPLSTPEQRLFRRLGLFTDSFSLESACALACDIDMTTQQLTEALMSLVSKSLIMADFHCSETRYRLLNTARAFAVDPMMEINASNPLIKS